MIKEWWLENLSVLQERFFLDSTTTNEANTIWTVPINYVTNTTAVNFANTQTTHWLDSAEATTDIELADGDWIILNKQAIGMLSKLK